MSRPEAGRPARTGARRARRDGWGAALAAAALLFATLLGAARPGHAYEVAYGAQILPDRGIARVAIEVEQADGPLRSVSFAVDPDRFFDESGDGELRRESEAGETRLVWSVPPGGGTLRYALHVDRAREDAEYEARCASTWMLARAEDLFPPMASRVASGAPSEVKATLRFSLPPGWEVAHPFAEVDGALRIEQGHRRLDQPKGWIVAGELDRLEADVAGIRIRLAAPRGHGAHLRDALAFLRWTLPELRAALGELPERILVVFAGDPMWRGGLSGPGSLYVHADRPFISDDASSPLLHELVHVVTRARSAPGDDWIVEGIAEHYSREVLRRSGAVSEETWARTLAALEERGERVRRMEGESTGAETARAVAFFAALDARIRETTDGARSLDDVAASLAGDVTPIDRAGLARRIRERTGLSEPDWPAWIDARVPPSAPASPEPSEAPDEEDDDDDEGAPAT